MYIYKPHNTAHVVYSRPKDHITKTPTACQMPTSTFLMKQLDDIFLEILKFFCRMVLQNPSHASQPLCLRRKGLVNCQQATCNSLQESCSLIRLQEYLLIIFMITIRWRPKSRNALGEKTVYFLENGIVQYIYILVIEKCP